MIRLPDEITTQVLYFVCQLYGCFENEGTYSYTNLDNPYVVSFSTN
jgi:hypothetical protein